jgi:transposase
MKRLVLENRNGIVNQIRDYLENNSEAKFIHRLQVILLFADSEDKSCDSLGALFGNSPRSISNWIKKVNHTDDIESLRSKPSSGRPSRLTQAQKEEIKTVLQDFPEKQGMQGRHWNGKNLSTYISEHYGIVLKVRSCQRLSHELLTAFH